MDVSIERQEQPISLDSINAHLERRYGFVLVLQIETDDDSLVDAYLGDRGGVEIPRIQKGGGWGSASRYSRA